LRCLLLTALVIGVATGCQNGSAGPETVRTPVTTPRPVRLEKPPKPTGLEQQLLSKDRAERIGAAASLLARTDEKSKATVRKILTDSNSESAREALIEALRIDPKPEYARLVVDNLSSPSRLCREAAGKTLTAYDKSAVSDLLLERLKATEPDADTRRRVIATLGALHEQRAVEPLVELLSKPELTDAASQALTDITGEKMTRPEQWQQWWAQNRSPNQMEWLRRELAAQKLTVAELRAELEAERRRQDLTCELVTEFLLAALRTRDTTKDPALLVEALQMPYEKVRVFANSELGRLKAADATQALSSVALTDSSALVRASAINALVLIDVEKVVPTLEKALQDSDPAVAASAATGLGKARAKAAVRSLLLALLHKSPKLRSASAEALGRIGDVRSVTPLLRVLGADEATEVREQAAKALGLLKDARAVPALVKTLEAPEASLRVFAIDALGELGETSVVEGLSQMLTTDRNPGVRQSLVVALGKLGDARALPALEAMMKDNQTDEKLRQLAFNALTDICRTDPDMLHRAGVDLLNEQDYAHASQLFELLLAGALDKPEHAKTVADTKDRLSQCYAELEQWTKAIKLLEELKKADAKDVTIAVRYARALAGAEKWPEAFRQYTELSRTKENAAGDYWADRLSLLENMISHKRYKQVLDVIDEVEKVGVDIPAEVGARLAEIKTKARKLFDASVKNQAEEAGKLVQLLGNESEEKRKEIGKKLRDQSTRAYPALVAGLTDENPLVRRGCYELLRQVSGETFDYDPDAAVEVRTQAVERWREWLKGAVQPTEPAATPQ